MLFKIDEIKLAREGEEGAPFDPADHVAVQGTSFQDTKAGRAICFDKAATVRKHLYAANFEDGAIIDLWSAGFWRHDHAEARMRSLETATEHQAIPGLEEMQDGRDTREREIGDKDGGIETGVAFFVLNGLGALLVEEGVGFEDCGGVSKGVERGGGNGLMDMMVLLRGWSWK
jgi:hypothetical protein